MILATFSSCFLLLLLVLLLELVLQASTRYPSPHRNTMLLKDGTTSKNMLPRGLTSLLDSVQNKAIAAAGPAGPAGPAAAAAAFLLFLLLLLVLLLELALQASLLLLASKALSALTRSPLPSAGVGGYLYIYLHIAACAVHEHVYLRV